jgi:hypothetical protein
MKCPECGREMEKGVITTNGYLVWSEEPIRSVWSGEEIPAEWGLFNPRHLEADRCEACRLIISHYMAID